MNRAQRRAVKQKRGSYLMYLPEVRESCKAQISNTSQKALSALHMSRQFEEDELRDLRLRIAMAWDSLKTFTGDESHWRLIAECMNDAQVRAEQISMELMPALLDAEEAMKSMRDRHIAGRSLGPDADALRTIPVALEIYDEILVNSSPKQMMDAAIEVRRRLG